MKRSPVTPPSTLEARHGADRILQHLNHELRQPLSSIESIAYYLEMVLSNAGQDVLDHCAELRRLVEESSWLLDDASLSIKLEGAEMGAVAAGSILEKLAAQMALHEERNVELSMEPGTPAVLAPACLAPAFLDHVLRFFRSVAQCADPLRVTLRPEDGRVLLAFSGLVGPDPGELTKVIDPRPHGNSVRRFMERCGGTLTFEHGDEHFRAVLLFQAAEEAA